MNEMTAVVDDTRQALPAPLPPMPPEIAKAIVVVMAQIRRLGKDTENKFQRYQYTSVDQFFEAVGPLMAEAGIFTLPIESSMEIERKETTNDQGQTKASIWLSATYDMYIYHASGASFGPISRSIQVPASGAQSYASAMSFVEKYFLRSLFKIPTGDADADGDDKRDLPPRSNNRTPPKPGDRIYREPTISEDQQRQLGHLMTAIGKGTWDEFSPIWGISRLSEMPVDKFGIALDQLKRRQAAPKANGNGTNGNGARTPPNPNKPAGAPSQSKQGAIGPIEFDAFRAALDACETLEAANAVFEREATNRKPQPTDDEFSECDNIMREISSKFYSEAAE